MKNDNIFHVYCDGGARGNPGLGAAACVVKNSTGKKRLLCGKYLGLVTNNVAEYSAVELALEKITENFQGIEKIYFFLDSKLVANQLAGIFKVKDDKLLNIILSIRNLERSIGEIYYSHIPREKNFEADKLVNRTIDNKSDFVQRSY